MPDKKQQDDEPIPYDGDLDELDADAEQQSTRDPASGYDRAVWDQDAGYADEAEDAEVDD